MSVPSGLSPSSDARPIRDLDDLAEQLSGALVTPDDPDWDEARRAWNLVVDQHPAAVVHPATPRELATIVRHCAATGRPMAMQCTGHAAATLEDLRETLLIRTTAMRGIVLDRAACRVRIAAGTTAHELAAAAASNGLSFLAGSSSDIGVVGYTLGGGLGWFGRRYGLACNAVVAAEVVTADGVERRVDEEHDPELFWALRGGGGAFAAVTALELQLFQVPQVYAGTLLWPIEHAAEVLHSWRVWTCDLPDTVASIARLLRYPPIPAVPPHLRGREFVGVEAAFLADEVDADIWLRALRALKPELDTFVTGAASKLSQLHGDPAVPTPAIADHRLLRTLPEEAVDAILDVAGPGVPSPLLAVDLRHLGGALGRSSPRHGALDRIDADYAMFAVGVPVAAELATAIPDHLRVLRQRLESWDAGVEYLNFADQPADPARLFRAEALARLRVVKATYDPDGRFVSNHPMDRPN